MEFDSQSKEKLTNSPAAIKQYFNDVDWDDFVKNIAKNEAITDPILINYKLKEELKNRLALKNMEKTDDKEIRCDKYFPSTGDKTYLAICEGDSAFGSLSAALGRDKIGYFAARGVPLNAYVAKVSKFTANKELANIVKVLNISLKKDTEQHITYKNIVIATDADCLYKNTNIMTDKGEKKIKELVYGDKVLTHTGEYKPIINIVSKKTNNFIRINVNGSNIYVTPYHKFPVLRNSAIIERYAKEIKRDDKILIKR